MNAWDEIYKLIRVSELGTDTDAAQAMKKLKEINPTYHYCPEWDYMVICSTDEEWEACGCEVKQLTR